MRVGLQVPRFTWPGGPARLGETFALIARNAERAGFSSFWVMDHFFQIGMVGPAELEMLEGYSALSFVAGQTNHIKLGTMVTGVTYRHPGLLVKTVTTLDVLSQGRAYLGIGAAWNQQEHAGLGVSFPPTAERFARLEEALQIALRMWSGNEEPFTGTYYHLERPLNSPQALQRPHPPILIGGTGERKTLRLVAQYGDACNLFARLGDEELRRKLDVLRSHCDQLGRPYEAIQKTALDTLFLTADGRDGSVTPQQAIDQFAHLAELGIDEVIVNMPNVSDLEVFDLLAEDVIPVVARVPVSGR
jgi:F420-dependent oxidoreductase-like protein